MIVFEEIWNAAPRYRPQGVFGSWLFAIVRGKLRKEWRRRRRRIVTAPMDCMEQFSSAESTFREAVESEEILLNALNALPSNQRDALLLNIHSTLSTEEICGVLGVSQTNLYVLIHRARAAVGRSFEET